MPLLVDDDVTVPDVRRRHFLAIQEAVVLVAEITGLVAHGDLLRKAGAERVGAGHDDTVFDAEFEERVAAGTDLREEDVVRHGHLAVLVSALLFVRDLVLDLQGASARFDHLPGEQIGRFRIAEAGIDVGDDGHDMGLEVVDLLDQLLFLRLVARLASGVEVAEDIVQLARVGLTQEGVEFFDQGRHRRLLVHRLVGQRSELGAERRDHPAGQIQIAAIGLAEMLLDRDQLLLGDEAMPAAQRLGVLGGVAVIGGHVGPHQRRGVAGDVEAGLETVLQAHARDSLGRHPVPGRLGVEERLGRLDLALIRSRALVGAVADPTWLVIHLRDPFGDGKSEAIALAIDILDSALRNACQELNANLPKEYR